MKRKLFVIACIAALAAGCGSDVSPRAVPEQTTITLTASTADGDTPSSDLMDQSKAIVDARFRATGVDVSKFEIDGNLLRFDVSTLDADRAANIAISGSLHLRPASPRGVRP